MQFQIGILTDGWWTLIAAVSSAILSVYLVQLWRKQDNRMITDLPLLFGIVFLGHFLSQTVVAFQDLGILEDTILYFQIRALFVGFISLPLVAVILHIWLPKYSHRHTQIVALVTLYWLIAVILGPSQEIIILLHLPIIMIFMGGMIVTFIVTWKTGRLKEVRSDLMVISGIFTLVRQVGLVVFVSLGLGWLNALFMIIGTFCAGLALTNPWYQGGL